MFQFVRKSVFDQNASMDKHLVDDGYCFVYVITLYDSLYSYVQRKYYSNRINRFLLIILNFTHLNLQTVFHICPLGLEEWFAVMKISLPVVLIDETLKFISRNYIDGKYKAENNVLIWLAVVVLMWIAFFVLTAYYPVFTLEQYASILFQIDFRFNWNFFYKYFETRFFLNLSSIFVVTHIP